jgi:hypothetical protein
MSYAILIESDHKFAQMIGGKLYRIPYHGFYLDVAILPFDRVETHIGVLKLALPHKGKIGFIN